MASLRFIPGRGFRIEWHTTIRNGPKSGQTHRGSQLVPLKHNTRDNRLFAEQVRDRIEKDLLAITYAGANFDKPWPAFLAEYQSAKSHQKTIKNAIAALTDLVAVTGIQTVSQFTGEAVSRYLLHRRGLGAGDSTVRNFLSQFAAAMTYACRKKYVAENPFAAGEIILPPKCQPRERFLTRAEFAQFLRSCRNQPRHMAGHARKFAYHAIFMVYTGLRITEYVTAKRCNLFHDRIIVEGKGKDGRNKIRPVPLCHHARWALKHLAAATGEFTFADKGNRFRWRDKYARWFAAAGIPEISPHVLRHTFGSWLAMSGTDLVSIQTVMGHANIQTTINSYLRLTPGHLAGATSNMRYHIRR